MNIIHPRFIQILNKKLKSISYINFIKFSWVAAGLLVVTSVFPANTWAGSGSIQLNQIGYLPASSKLAVAPAGVKGEGSTFTVAEAATGKVVISGKLSHQAEWLPARQHVQIADFSALTTPGHYRLHINGLPPSDEFVIASNAYETLGNASLKAYYYHRVSTALLLEYVADPRYARAAGHTRQVRIHTSAASENRPAGTMIDALKGWYDAGDYGKYIVSTSVTTGTLMAAWEAFPQAFRSTLNIPESGNGAPDILNQVWWALEWMLTMQDPADGGVYHKLSSLDFEGFVMPAKALKQRYVFQKSTAATLDFAAVMAQASRIYAKYDKQFPGAAPRMLAASKAAWQWAQKNPHAFYRQPPDVHTGMYDDTDVQDEFAWAAAELLITTGEDAYYRAFVAQRVSNSVPSWRNVGGMAWMELASHRTALPARYNAYWDAQIKYQINRVAAPLAVEWSVSPYRVAMQGQDFIWGSNAIALNQAMMLIQAYRLDPQRRYLDAAQSQLDYVLGRNPLARSFITGFGTRPPRFPHHRTFVARGMGDPVPGWMVGGPNRGQEDLPHCQGKHYPSKLPALSYMDDICSYASNEIAINWNAPLVYVTAALQTLTPQSAAPSPTQGTFVKH
jgi:endoglucanase